MLEKNTPVRTYVHLHICSCIQFQLIVSIHEENNYERIRNYFPPTGMYVDLYVYNFLQLNKKQKL